MKIQILKQSHLRFLSYQQSLFVVLWNKICQICTLFTLIINNDGFINLHENLEDQSEDNNSVAYSDDISPDSGNDDDGSGQGLVNIITSTEIITIIL